MADLSTDPPATAEIATRTSEPGAASRGDSGYPVGIGPFAALFALWSLACTTSHGNTILVGIPAGAALLAGFVAAPGPVSAADVAGNLLAVAGTLLVGDLLRARRDQNALLAQRNRELETLREAQMRSAIVEERMRIAREVHSPGGSRSRDGRPSRRPRARRPVNACTSCRLVGFPLSVCCSAHLPYVLPGFGQLARTVACLGWLEATHGPQRRAQRAARPQQID